jgi:putative hydrolase of the HAD superfamily
MILIFDLDDVLYEEMSFVRSGFAAVSFHLASRFGLSSRSVYTSLGEALEQHGRGRIFDKVLSQYGLYSRALVRRCLSVYRSHVPHISLYPDAKSCLERFWAWPTYVVTDGNQRVQRRKIERLRLEEDFVRRALATHAYGLACAKPSPYCFLKIVTWEKAAPEQAVYIGDNPNKDFVGLKPLGFKTVRLLRGPYQNVKMPARYEADLKIDSLDEITPDLLNSL